MSDEARLAALRELQARFLAAVRARDWTLAQLLQEQRFAQIDALLQERPVAPAVASELAALARGDRALLPEVEAAREACAGELRELGRGRRALVAYGTEA